MPAHINALNQPHFDYHHANRHADSLKSILVAIMIADNKIHREELDAFMDALDHIDTQNDHVRDETKLWLEDNIGEINAMIHGPNRKRWLALQFLKLRDYPDKDKALDYLWRVAVADGDLHVNEAAIIDKALWLWK